MSKKPAVPDAWDDNWESQADAEPAMGHAPVEKNRQLTKAERLARHAETNKKIWKSAEEPETFHFLAVHDNVPLKSEFKPALTLLSRKPTPKLVEQFNPITGLTQLAPENDPDDVELQVQHCPQELKLKAQREREEKQKRYDLARARILGIPSMNTSGGKVTGSGTTSSRGPISTRGGRRGEGSGRKTSSDVEPGKSTHKGSGASNYTLREKKGIIRAPKAPDPSVRGGSGFAARGGKSR